MRAMSHTVPNSTFVDVKENALILTVEVGGSSTQVIQFNGPDDNHVVSLDKHRADPWLLAAPGLVEGDRVRGAHHLGWMDVQASHELGMHSPPDFSMNDAEAAALGEWWLRDKPPGTWLYVGLGTGVGAAAVAGSALIPVEFSHLTAFGPHRCGGCGRIGCLDAQTGGHALPTALGEDDIGRVVDILSAAIAQLELEIDAVVVGGGMARNHPSIVSRLDDRTRQVIELSLCPDGYKSAAPLGLIHAWQNR